MRQRVTCKKALSIRTTEGFVLLFLSVIITAPTGSAAPYTLSSDAQ